MLLCPHLACWSTHVRYLRNAADSRFLVSSGLPTSAHARLKANMYFTGICSQYSRGHVWGERVTFLATPIQVPVEFSQPIAGRSSATVASSLSSSDEASMNAVNGSNLPKHKLWTSRWRNAHCSAAQSHFRSNRESRRRTGYTKAAVIWPSAANCRNMRSTVEVSQSTSERVNNTAPLRSLLSLLASLNISLACAPHFSTAHLAFNKM